MLRNYIRIAFRNIIRQRGYSLINIIGLAVGMTCCILIMLWVMDELSYDRYHKNAINIYRVIGERQFANRKAPFATLPPQARDLLTHARFPGNYKHHTLLRNPRKPRYLVNTSPRHCSSGKNQWCRRS
jgi:hypothetical protein